MTDNEYYDRKEEERSDGCRAIVIWGSILFGILVLGMILKALHVTGH